MCSGRNVYSPLLTAQERLLPLCSAVPGPALGSASGQGGQEQLSGKFCQQVLGDSLRQDFCKPLESVVDSAGSLGPLSWQPKLGTSPRALQSEDEATRAEPEGPCSGWETGRVASEVLPVARSSLLRKATCSRKGLCPDSPAATRSVSAEGVLSPLHFPRELGSQRCLPYVF